MRREVTKFNHNFGYHSKQYKFVAYFTAANELHMKCYLCPPNSDGSRESIPIGSPENISSAEFNEHMTTIHAEVIQLLF